MIKGSKQITVGKYAKGTQTRERKTQFKIFVIIVSSTANKMSIYEIEERIR